MSFMSKSEILATNLSVIVTILLKSASFVCSVFRARKKTHLRWWEYLFSTFRFISSHRVYHNLFCGFSHSHSSSCAHRIPSEIHILSDIAVHYWGPGTCPFCAEYETPAQLYSRWFSTLVVFFQRQKRRNAGNWRQRSPAQVSII